MSQITLQSNPIEGKILQNINQIVMFLKENGYLTSYNTVSKHINDGALVARRGEDFPNVRSFRGQNSMSSAGSSIPTPLRERPRRSLTPRSHGGMPESNLS